MGSSALHSLFRLRVRPSALPPGSSLFHCTAQTNPIAPIIETRRLLRVVERTELELSASDLTAFGAMQIYHGRGIRNLHLDVTQTCRAHRGDDPGSDPDRIGRGCVARLGPFV